MQKYIVEKVLVGVDKNVAQINGSVSDLIQKLESIENACKTIDINLTMLFKKNDNVPSDISDILTTLDEIKKQVKTLKKIPESIKQFVPKEDVILESMTSRWHESIAPINEKVLDLEKVFQNVIENVSNMDHTTKNGLENVNNEFVNLKELLNIEKEELNQIAEIVNTKNETLHQNDIGILKELQQLRQTTKYLWMTIGVNVVLVIGVLLALFIK